MAKQLTLIIPQVGNRVLLGMKKRGFGSGKWNGFGGKVEPGEGIVDAARRELKEECDVYCGNLEQRAVIQFNFRSEMHDLEIHVFHTSGIEGEPKETEEMKPAWFEIENIPYESMWPDDRFWLPKFLSGECLKGRFSFDEDESTILNYSLDSVDRSFFS